MSTENLPMGQERNRGRDHIPKVNYGDLGLVRIHDTQARVGSPWCYLLGNYGDLFYFMAVLGMKPRASAVKLKSESLNILFFKHMCTHRHTLHTFMHAHMYTHQ